MFRNLFRYLKGRRKYYDEEVTIGALGPRSLVKEGGEMRKLLFAVLASCIAATAYGLPNHNAVLICGEKATEDAKVGWEWGRIGERIQEGQAEKQPLREFWLDTYLMWELLFDNSNYSLFCPDPTASDAYKYDHIHVLYGDGNDWTACPNDRYKASIRYPGIHHITDQGAYYQDVENIFDWLENGKVSQNIEKMTDKDDLFCWTFDHGTRATLLRVVDVTTPSAPIEVNSRWLPGMSFNSTLVGDNLYIALGSMGFTIFDVSNPSDIEQLGYARTKEFAHDICVTGDHAYVAGYGPEHFLIYDVSIPSSPSHVEDIELPELALGIDAGVSSWGMAYCAIAAALSGITFVNVNDPADPVYLGTHRWAPEFSHSYDTDVVGDYVFVAELGMGLRIDKITQTGIEGVGECQLPASGSASGGGC
jgi:hypothetical protein